MIQKFTRKEAFQLQQRWLSHAVYGTKEDPDIENVLEDLNHAWINGATLGLGERQALATWASVSRIGFADNKVPSLQNGWEYCPQTTKRLTEIEAFYGIAEMNVDEWAKRSGKVEPEKFSIL